MKSYLEITDEKLALQMGNFSSKIDAYSALFGFTPAEVTAMKADAAYFIWVVNNFKKVDTYKMNWTAFKNTLKKGKTKATANTAPAAPGLDVAPAAVAPGLISRFTTFVNRIKAHQAYTSAIGKNLGIELATTSVQTANVAEAKPSLKALFSGGEVHLLWKKGGYSGILIEKDSGAGFVALDKDYHPDFIDHSPLPEQGKGSLWKYRAIYLNKDEKVGQWSDVVSISVGN